MNMQKLLILALLGVSAMAAEPICCKDCPENKNKYYSIADDSGPWLCGETCIRNVSNLSPTLNTTHKHTFYSHQISIPIIPTNTTSHTVFLSDLSYFREESYEELVDEHSLCRRWIHGVRANCHSRWWRFVLYVGFVLV